MDSFRIDELAIDPRAGEMNGPGGQEKLDPKVMDVLVMLARDAGRVVLVEVVVVVTVVLVTVVEGVMGSGQPAGAGRLQAGSGKVPEPS